MNIKHFLSFLTLFYSGITIAQIQSVDYHLGYNPETCQLDVNLIINEGSAESYIERIQFNAQLSIVVPTSSVVSIAESFNPKLNNQTGNGVTPINWIIANDIEFNSSSTFVAISPTISPIGSYDTLNTGDTVHLFSLDIQTPSHRNLDEVRLWENDVDPDSSDPNMAGADFTNGFTMGGLLQLYNGNAISNNPMGLLVDTIVGGLSGDTLRIDVAMDSSQCMGGFEYRWYSPNGDTIWSRDVLKVLYNSTDLGTYEFVVISDSGFVYMDTVILLSDPNDAIQVGGISIYPSMRHIGIHSSISMDSNQNSTCVYKYKRKGDSTYQLGAPIVRTNGSALVDGEVLGEEYYGGSLMFLSPNTQYDVRIEISDAEGGGMVIDTTVNTLKYPEICPTGQVLYVEPGNGGGGGTINDPYLGLQEGVNHAGPGDILICSDGIYAPFTLTTSGTKEMPITIRSGSLHGAVIEGGNTSGGIITLGVYDDSISHVIVDGFVVQNGRWGIDAQNTQHVLIRNNKIEDVDYGYVNRRENGWEHHQIITNNKIEGRTTWPQTNGNIPSERGVDIRGNYNTISYNTITDFGDGISTDGSPYKTSYCLDIHNNWINRVVDDAIEVDGMVSNTRVYENRCYNARVGVSMAPVYGGPLYVFRNEIVNMEGSAFKMNRSPYGLHISNNTVVNSENGMSSPSGWRHVSFKNNVVVSGRYTFEEYALITTANIDWNYNGYYSSRGGNASEPWFKWDNTKYDDLMDLQSNTNVESNGATLSLSDFMLISIPTSYDQEVLYTDYDLSPQMSGGQKDSGTTIENMTSRYVIDGLPDMGAIEMGGLAVEYGHDFGNLCDRNSTLSMVWNGSINGDWYEPNNWTPCGTPSKNSNVIIPIGIANYPVITTDVHIANWEIHSTTPVNIVGEDVEVQVGQ